MDTTKLSIKQRIALELARQLRQNEKELHVLRQLFWECTLRCNLQCKHCGSDCKHESVTPDMPFSDFLKAIDSITPHVDPHKTMIIFSGGEPLMRKDLEACGAELYRRGFPWGMVSNGLALTEQRLNSLKRAGLRSVTISLDGLEEDHNWLRGNHESFKKASNAISLIAAEKDLISDVVTCVNHRNISSLDQIADHLLTLGMKNWRLFTIAPMGRARDYPELQISKDEFKTLMSYIEQTRLAKKINCSYSCEGFLGAFEGKVRDHLYQCNAGISTASVLIDGSISGCTSIRSHYYQGNIYQDDFWTIWNTKFDNYRNRNWMKQDSCGSCPMFRYCEGGGMHLRDENGKLMVCHYERLQNE